MDFIIKDKIIKLDKASLEGKKVVSYNSGYEARFIFDEEWDDLTKTARFINDGEYMDVELDANDACEIPIDILKSGTLEVGVYAGNLSTTTAAKVSVKPSIVEDSGSPLDPDTLPEWTGGVY